MSDPVYLDKPWRKFPEFDAETLKQLKRGILNYQPERSSVSTANILLVGLIGAGKSSVFNSVNSIFRGKITGKARSGSFEHSLTIAFRKYSIKDYSSGKTLKIRLCDTRGIEEDFAVDTQEMTYILNGNIPDRYQFNPTLPFTPKTPGFIESPELKDKIHCVAFVVDGSTIELIPEKTREQLKDLQSLMNRKGIPQVVYVTKLDKVCPAVHKDPTGMFHSKAVHDAVEKAAVVMGLPRCYVYPIINYESETSLEPNFDILFLNALKQTTDFANDYIEDEDDKMAKPSYQYCSIL